MFATITSIVLWLCSGLMLALTTFTDRNRIQDLIKYEVDQRFTRDAQTIKNLNAAAIGANTLAVGTPLSLSAGQYGILQTGDEANVKALFLGTDSSIIHEALAANAITAGKYQILVRGPAIINRSIIPTTDGDGGTIDVDAVCTALAALNIVTMKEPVSTATGTQST
jgi:hypothetical protein